MALALIPVAAAFIGLVLLSYQYLIYPAFLSPLAKIPNAHWTCSFSSLWILYQRFRCRNNQITFAAHKAHGPIVRLGPRELSVNCVDGGIRTIYAGGFEKHEWYPNQFPSYGVINMFSTVGHYPHSVKKRIMANIYSKSFLQTSEQIKTNSLVILRDRFLPMIQRYAETGEEVDVHELNNAFTMDFMSAYQYGLANSTKFLQDIQARRKMLHEYHSRRDYEFYNAEVPKLRDWSRVFGNWRLIPKFADEANRYLEHWGRNMAQGADGYLGNVDNPGNEPVVYKHFKTGFWKLAEKESDGASLAPEQVDYNNRTVYSEMLDHLGAGHETSAVALTYLYLEMSRRPELQLKLREEIQTLRPQIIWPPSTSMADFTLPDPKQIDNLPLLHAVLMETLRLHAPIPGMEPRVTPATPCTLAGYPNIPPGTRVSAMPYCLHRNPQVFPEPETWKPERWLTASAEEHKEMLRWFWAFGSGGRMCIGSHLAVQEIKLVVCAVYGNFGTKVSEGGDVDVEEIDAYTTKPKSNRLGLHFVKA